MGASLPLDVGDITPAWLTTALAPRHPGVRVSGVDVLAERGSTNHHVRLGLTYDEPAGAPATLFCKMASIDPAHRAAIGSTGMGAREAHFYAELATSVPMRTPISHFAASAEDGAFVLLLEDLSTTGCVMSDGTWGISPDLAAGALEDLARLHVQFEAPGALDAIRPWVSTASPGAAEFTVGMLRHVVDSHPDALSPAYIAVAEMYIADPDAVIGLWQAGQQTLIHGDTHIANLFIDGSRVGFLDWGLLTTMTPMRDVSYFLTMSMMPEDRRAVEGDLLQHYVDVHASLGGFPLSLEEAWHAHRVHTGYTVLASFLSLVPPYNGEDQREFSDAFRNRAITAIDDLDAAATMRAALG
ncbi:MAG: hypothetical protein JWM34_175 [Ilumatobacteraceae bacterium]|nr:hypothetical protein [Ilumatobacteraceae bacterium]